jgi:hypothetical protein
MFEWPQYRPANRVMTGKSLSPSTVPYSDVGGAGHRLAKPAATSVKPDSGLCMTQTAAADCRDRRKRTCRLRQPGACGDPQIAALQPPSRGADAPLACTAAAPRYSFGSVCFACSLR